MTRPASRTLRYVEILAPGGIVRVNTGLVDVRTRQTVVVVEIEQNAPYCRRTSPGGHWETSVRQHAGIYRTDVTLTRTPEGEGSA